MPLPHSVLYNMREITFDIETVPLFATQRVDPAEQELTVIAIHDSKNDTYTSYIREELPKLWPIIEETDLLIGFNSNTFDIPILNRYYPGDLSQIPSLDLLVEVQKSLGRRIRLDLLAQATLGKAKSGAGTKAIEWWREGKVDTVRKYCIDDVRITKGLYDYALKYKALKYKDLRTMRDMKIDTSLWPKQPIKRAFTHTLPI